MGEGAKLGVSRTIRFRGSVELGVSNPPALSHSLGDPVRLS